MLDNVRSPRHRFRCGSPAQRIKRLKVNLVSHLGQETDHEGPGTVAEASSRSSWPTLALHPRGGHGSLSASHSRRFTQLEKIDKMTDRGTLGTLTSFQRLARPTSRIAIHPKPLVSRTKMAYLGGGAIEQDEFTDPATKDCTAGESWGAGASDC